MSRTKKCNKSLNDEGVVFEFIGGETHTVNLADFSDEIVRNLALHGLSQKLGDSYSGTDTVEKAEEMFKGTLENLKAGNWKAQRESSGKPRTTQLVDAMARVTGKTIAECAEMLDGKSDDEKAAIRKHPAVAAEIAKIQAEKAAAKAAEMADEAGDTPLDLG